MLITTNDADHAEENRPIHAKAEPVLTQQSNTETGELMIHLTVADKSRRAVGDAGKLVFNDAPVSAPTARFAPAG
jgi:hypothetical protein